MGPAGRDLGLFEAFPLSCVIAHAVNGNPQCSNDIMTFIDRVWNEYGAQLKAHCKTDADVRHAYKDALVFCGFFMCAYSGLGIHMNFLPIDEETAAEDLEKAKESIGVIGLKAIMLGCGPDDTSDLSLEDFQAELKAAVEQEMALHDTTDARRRSRRNRRSSALRASGIRVSDGHLHLGSLDRTSIVEVNRRSSSIMLNMGDLKLDEMAEMTESQ